MFRSTRSNYYRPTEMTPNILRDRLVAGYQVHVALHFVLPCGLVASGREDARKHRD